MPSIIKKAVWLPPILYMETYFIECPKTIDRNLWLLFLEELGVRILKHYNRKCYRYYVFNRWDVTATLSKNEYKILKWVKKIEIPLEYYASVKDEKRDLLEKIKQAWSMQAFWDWKLTIDIDLLKEIIDGGSDTK